MMNDKFTDERIEEHLRRAVNDSTPDILDTLLEEIQREPSAAEQEKSADDPKQFQTQYRQRRRKWYKSLAGCAAALVIFVGAFTVFHKSQDEVLAVVDIDVNPSVELSVDDANRILEAKALNEDGEIILEDMDLNGIDLNTGCNALIGSMVNHGYLSELSNSVMVSVQSEDAAEGHRIEQLVSGNLNDSLHDANIDGAVLGQYVESDEALAAFASENNISPGKAWLIKNLLATNSRHMSEEALLQLTTQELILLSQERDVDVDDFYGEVDKSKYISKEEAVNIALQAAGLMDVQPDAEEVEFDCDDGIITYEVEFTANGQEYEYDINAETGEVLVEDADDDDDADDDHDDADDDHDDDDDHEDDD